MPCSASAGDGGVALVSCRLSAGLHLGNAVLDVFSIAAPRAVTRWSVLAKHAAEVGCVAVAFCQALSAITALPFLSPVS